MLRSRLNRTGAGLTVLLLTAAAAGCTAAPSSSSSTPPPKAGTLDVVMSPHSLTTYIQENLAEFEAASGMKVNITSLNEDQVSQQLRVEFGAANTTTDVFLFRPPQDAAQFVNNGWIADLTSKVADSGFDWNDFGQAARDAVTSREGAVVAVPVATARQMLFYRKDLLDAKGLGVPTPHFPRCSAIPTPTAAEIT